MNSAALHTAAFTRLSGFAALTASLGSGGVASRHPQDDQAEAASVFPYVTFDFPSLRGFDTNTTDGVAAVLRVHVWARTTSDIQWRALQDAVYDCLHNYALPIAGANTVNCQFTSASDMQDPDGKTIHAWSDFDVTYDNI